ncbi:FkbM family methyltransferase [Methanopyrus sp.]
MWKRLQTALGLYPGMGNRPRRLWPRLLYSGCVVLTEIVDAIMDKLKHNRDVVRVQVEGVSFLLRVHTNDSGVSRELRLHNIREPKASRYLVTDFLNDREIAFDVGANIGYYAILTALASEQSRVYAIEPIRENLELLQENIALNNLEDRVKAFEYAVSDKCGRVRMILENRSNWHRIVNVDNSDYIEVESITLDELSEKLGERPTYVRMDVEGAEFEVIRGMVELLESDDPPKLFIEHHIHLLGLDVTLDLIETLLDYGFEIAAAFGYPHVSLHDREGGYRALVGKVVRWRGLDVELYEPSFEQLYDVIVEKSWDCFHVFYRPV